MESAVGDPVQSYFNEIGRTPLLSAEQEIDLAKRAAAGREAVSLLESAGDFTPQMRARLRRLVTDGQRATDHLIRANLRLVVSIARRYRNNGLDLLDLIQEGNLGLMRAVERFDHRKGYRFSTYATWWIRQALTRGLAHGSRLIRLPVHAHEMLGSLRLRRRELLRSLGREPDESELADALGVSVERLREVVMGARDLLSLDVPIGEDSVTPRGSLVPDERAINPESAAAMMLIRKTVRAVLNDLDERERSVLQQRFGIDDGNGDGRTLEDIGRESGVTRERIRQIEIRSLRKLQAPDMRARLEGLLEIVDGADPGIAI